MRIFRRLISMSFWYELSLKLTISGALKGIPELNSTDLKKIKREYISTRKDNRNFIYDVPSEYHVSWCSIVLAIYRICNEKGIDKKKSIEIAEMAVFSTIKPDTISKHIEAALDKSDNAFEYIVNSSKKLEKNFFGKTFLFERRIDDSKSYHLHVKKCIYYDFFRKNMAPELMLIACKWDMISWTRGIKTLKHKIVFERPVTLGLDGKDCEFNFDKTE